MSNNPKPSSDKAKKDLLRYAGLATQLLTYLSIAVFAGIKLDRWWHSFPFLTVLFPLLVLGALFYKLFKETGGSN
ncbi:MAG: AtpZ/AtpI family protein [Chitinophagaceae bacterium]|jgi:F0F1-type ATP synthase assembly protein I